VTQTDTTPADAIAVSTAVPAPADALDTTAWDNRWDEGQPVRQFTGSSWLVPPMEQHTADVSVWSRKITVGIEGVQRADGRVGRYVTVDGEHYPASAARLLAAALADAVAEIERLAV